MNCEIVGKPYVAQIYEHGGRTYSLPIPPKFREVLDCAKTLKLRDSADEDDLYVIGHETLMGLPIPDACTSESLVVSIAEKISELTTEQVKAVAAICAKFDVGYAGIGEIIDCIKEKQGGGYEV